MNYFKYLVGLFGVMCFDVSAFGNPEPKAYRLYVLVAEEVLQAHLTKTLNLSPIEKESLQTLVGMTYSDAFQNHRNEILEKIKEIRDHTLRKLPKWPMFTRCFSDDQDIYIIVFSKIDYIQSRRLNRESIPKSVVLVFSLEPSKLFLKGLKKPQNLSLEEHLQELSRKLREDIASHIQWPEIGNVDLFLEEALLAFLNQLPRGEYFNQ